MPLKSISDHFKGRVQKKKNGIFHTLVGWVGLKKSFSIKKIKKHGLKLPKYSFKNNLFLPYGGWSDT